MGETFIAIAAAITAAASAAGAAYQIVSSEDAKDAQKKAQDALRTTYGIGKNQDPSQQLAAKLNEQTLDAQHSAEQTAQLQAQLAAEEAQQKKTLMLVIGGGAALFLLTRK